MRISDWSSYVCSSDLRAQRPGVPRMGRVRQSHSGMRPEPLTDLSQYLPILIFLVIALALSAVIVFLPMGVARLTGPDRKGVVEGKGVFVCVDLGGLRIIQNTT